MINTIAGMRIIFTPMALKESTERLFPASRHRSKRIHKKLVKRFGGEFRKVPCIWRTPIGLVAHPSFAEALHAAATPKATGESGKDT